MSIAVSFWLSCHSSCEFLKVRKPLFEQEVDFLRREPRNPHGVAKALAFRVVNLHILTERVDFVFGRLRSDSPLQLRHFLLKLFFAVGHFNSFAYSWLQNSVLRRSHRSSISSAVRGASSTSLK
jgi:hypothetical protein